MYITVLYTCSRCRYEYSIHGFSNLILKPFAVESMYLFYGTQRNLPLFLYLILLKGNLEGVFTTICVYYWFYQNFAYCQKGTWLINFFFLDKLSTSPIFLIKSHKSLYLKNGPIKTYEVLYFYPFNIMNLRRVSQ